MSRITPVSTWDPFTALARMDREFDALVRRAFPTQRGIGAGFVPAVELQRDAEDVLVVCELPGIDIEDVNIEVDSGKLVISGERRDPNAESSDNVLVRELRYGSFRREFALPGGVSADRVEASYDAGLLTVRVKGVVQPEPTPVKIPIAAARAKEAKVLEGKTDK